MKLKIRQSFISNSKSVVSIKLAKFVFLQRKKYG